MNKNENYYFKGNTTEKMHIDSITLTNLFKSKFKLFA